MVTITVSPVIIMLGAPMLLALAVGAVFAALTWVPTTQPADPIWTMAAGEVALAAVGLAIWMGVTQHAALCLAALALAVLAVVATVRWARVAHLDAVPTAPRPNPTTSLSRSRGDHRGR